MTQPAKPLDQRLYKRFAGDAPFGSPAPDDQFAALRTSCEPQEERYDHYEGQWKPAGPPDYKQARQQAFDILLGSRDVRVLGYLLEIEASQGGALGLHAALHLIWTLATESWDELQPLAGPATRHARALSDQDASDGRVAALNRITSALQMTINGVLDYPLYVSRRLKAEVALKHLLHGAGVQSLQKGRSPITPENFEDVIRADRARSTVVAACDALDSASLLAERLHEWAEARGDLRDVDLQTTMAGLTGLAISAGELAEKVTAIAGAEDDQDLGNADDAGPLSASVATTSLVSHEEAAQVFAELLGYFARTAPSSPIALVLAQLNKLRGASFVTWSKAINADLPDTLQMGLSDIDMAELMSLAGEAQDGEDAPANPTADDARATLLRLLDVLNAAREEQAPAAPADSPPAAPTADGPQNSGDAGDASAPTEPWIVWALQAALQATGAMGAQVGRLVQAVSLPDVPPQPASDSNEPPSVHDLRLAAIDAQITHYKNAAEPEPDMQVILRRSRRVVEELNRLREALEETYKKRGGSVPVADLAADRVLPADPVTEGFVPVLRPTPGVSSDMLDKAVAEAETLGRKIDQLIDAAPRQQVAGQIQTREDVVAAIDSLIEFYADQDPGSPMQVVLRRTRRLVNMTYLEIVSALQVKNDKAVLPLKDAAV